MVVLRSLYAGYGKKEVVRDVSVDLNSGELTVLLGLNGCGKSTLIKAICGFDDIQSGECGISQDEEFINLQKLNERERAWYIAYIPQRGSYISGMSALKVVMMGYNARLGIFSEPSTLQEKEALTMMSRLEIEELADKEYEELSEGQKQMVILARCLVQNTPVMLMDEPDSALDYVNKRKILFSVSEIVHSEDKSCLIALHDPNLALQFADRILMMKDGRIIHDIKPKEATKDAVEEQMRDIYGDVKVIEAEGRRILI